MSPASWNLTQICMISDDGNRQLRCSRSHNVQISLLANETGFGAASSNTEIENAVSSLYGWFLARVQTGDYCFWIDSDVHVRRWCIAPAMFFHRLSFSCKFPPQTLPDASAAGRLFKPQQFTKHIACHCSLIAAPQEKWKSEHLPAWQLNSNNRQSHNGKQTTNLCSRVRWWKTHDTGLRGVRLKAAKANKRALSASW